MMPVATPSVLEELATNQTPLVKWLYSKWSEKISYEEAEDIVSNAFLEALEQPGKFEQSCEREIYKYIYRAIFRDAHDFARSPRSKRATIDVCELPPTDGCDELVEIEEAELCEMRRSYGALIAKTLSARERHVVELLLVQDLSWKDCAQELGISRQRLQRARKGALLKLRVALAANEPTIFCGGVRQKISSKSLSKDDLVHVNEHVVDCLPCLAFSRLRTHHGRLGAWLPLPVVGFVSRVSSLLDRRPVQGGAGGGAAASGAALLGSGGAKFAISCAALCAVTAGSLTGAEQPQRPKTPAKVSRPLSRPASASEAGAASPTLIPAPARHSKSGAHKPAKDEAEDEFDWEGSDDRPAPRAKPVERPVPQKPSPTRTLPKKKSQSPTGLDLGPVEDWQ